MFWGLSILSIVIILGIGVLIGWIAGLITKGKGFGFLGNIVVAVLGSLLGGFITGILGIKIGSFLTAILGSVLLVVIVNLVRGKK